MLLIVFYGFMFVVLPGVGALASATLLARRNRTGVTVASTLAAIPIVGYELFARNVETTVAFGGALLVGAYLGGAVALLVRGDHESDDRLVVGGATLWTALLVGIALPADTSPSNALSSHGRLVTNSQKAPARSTRAARCAPQSLRSFRCLRRRASSSPRPLSVPPC
ncbi:hypothetical protein BRC81_10550 [Halobacteriales archaeon QS_1_68_20]|nr:MAG: hypothetical protein BRC81_10550 [Halobacteriales archaeon QS_1_68_20]